VARRRALPDSATGVAPKKSRRDRAFVLDKSAMH
jgi:hypothetical protein